VAEVRGLLSFTLRVNETTAELAFPSQRLVAAPAGQIDPSATRTPEAGPQDVGR
jgi:hypothetical protein